MQLGLPVAVAAQLVSQEFTNLREMLTLEVTKYRVLQQLVYYWVT